MTEKRLISFKEFSEFCKALDFDDGTKYCQAVDGNFEYLCEEKNCPIFQSFPKPTFANICGKRELKDMTERKLTNFDSITESPEKLIEFIFNNFGCICGVSCPVYKYCEYHRCYETWMNWINQEADNEQS